VNPKITKIQQDVLDKVNDGWELGCYFNSGCNLQKGGLGKGGKTEKVSHATVTSLVQKHFIKGVYGFPAIRYILIKEEERESEPLGTRTPDTLIKSQVLYSKFPA